MSTPKRQRISPTPKTQAQPASNPVKQDMPMKQFIVISAKSKDITFKRMTTIEIREMLRGNPEERFAVVDGGMLKNFNEEWRF
jgi:hypothetical protein